MKQKLLNIILAVSLGFTSINCFSQQNEENEQVDKSSEVSKMWNGLKNIISNSAITSSTSDFSYDKANIAKSGYLGLHRNVDTRTGYERIQIRNKMIALAEHISDEHDIEYKKAQKIIDTTFLEAERANIEPILMLSVIGVESKYKQFAKSKMGAVGLVQVMPNYHRTKINELKKDNLDMWSVEGNIKLGVTIMKEYINLANGDIQRALQMYNGSTRDSRLTYSKKVFNQMENLDKALVLAKMWKIS